MSSIPFFVGSYTTPQDHVPGACGEGIYYCQLDLSTGEISLLYSISALSNPTYLVKEGRFLYGAAEIYEENSTVFGLEIKEDGNLSLITEIATNGKANCHVHIHNHYLFSTAYGSGNMDIYKIDGGILTHIHLIQYHGSGPNLNRQQSAHAHQATTSPDGRWLYVCDLGADKIWYHSHKEPYDQTVGFTMTPPGSGPRHAVFHPTLPLIFVAAELTAHLFVYKYEPSDGSLTLIQDIYTLPNDFQGLPSSAAIRVHTSGQSVYISNRQHNSIAVYGFDENGSLTLQSRISSGGREPRDIAIDPTGNFLLITNQDDNNITVYKLNPDNGIPEQRIHHTFECNTPVCIAF